MFTFGREHEKTCAIRCVKGENNTFLVEKLTDAIHDLLEQKINPSELNEVLKESFEAGGSGVWEQAANWLRRLGKKYPDLLYGLS